MPTDPGDADFHTPEEKRKMYERFAAPKPSAWSSFTQGIGTLIFGVLYLSVWIVTIVIVLIVGVAIIKWAIEELAK